MSIESEPILARVELDGVQVSTSLEDVRVGLVLLRGCVVEPAPEALASRLDSEIARAVGRTDTEPMTQAVRGLLRHGRYKPTGRGKPASEYLFGAAREARFPRINNLVDINNLVSLATLLPISLIDLGRAGCTNFLVRRGRPGESYVFNSAGQVIELEDLLLVAMLPDDRPCANPVKDSMATKLDAAARDVLAVVYAPLSMHSACATAVEQLAALAAAHGGKGPRVHTALLTAPES